MQNNRVQKNIAVLAGDGVGPEVMQSAITVLDAISEKFGHAFDYQEAKIGGAAYDEFRNHCPESTMQICKNADAILFGSVGGPVDGQNLPKWKNCEANSILALRKHFKFNINIRPISMYESLMDISPLKTEVIGATTDIVIFRELIGDIYFGKHIQSKDENNIRYATDLAEYNEKQIASIVHKAFQSAQMRTGKLTSVDKANVLATSRLWREIVNEISIEYPKVKVEHLYVDNCAMQLVLNPSQFDVIVTANLFGDILSDLAAVLPGSIGLVPSASLNANGFGLYEPSGGSAPSIEGLGIANPIAQILSSALMLEHSFNMGKEANCIRKAIRKTLNDGYRSVDIAKNKQKYCMTSDISTKIIENIMKFD